jgi:mannose-6-phosphate isomerase-like protein (cupin superfamily)
VVIEPINLAEKFARFEGRWRPKIVAELNGQHVKLVKILGDFPLHHHEHEDELFLVVAGRMEMRFHDRAVPVEAGEMIVIPRGVEHAPYAEEEAQILLFEPSTTVNTGNVRSERTAPLEWI